MSRSITEIAGELIFASADDDGEAFLRLCAEVSEHRLGAIRLIALLSSASARLMQTIEGDAWRDALNLSLLANSLELPDDLA